MTFFDKHPNSIARIVSLIMACVLWIYVMNEQNPAIEMSYTVPIEQRNLGQKLIVTDSPDKAKVILKAPRTTLFNVTEKDLQAYVDLKGLDEGQYSLPVRVIAPQSIETKVQPEVVSIRLDDEVERRIPIEVNFIGNVATNITIGKTIVTPNEARILGANSRVATVSKVVAYLNLNQQTKDIKQDIKLVALDANNIAITDVGIKPEVVNVTAKLLQTLALGNFPVKIATTGALPEGTAISSITSTPERVNITAKPEILAQINEIRTVPIDLSTITADTTLKVKLAPIENVELSVQEIDIKITLKKQ